ncbi:eCIS core domain-containing protein [Aquimarina sp. M1]
MKTTSKTKNTTHTNAQTSKPFFNKSGAGTFFSNSKEAEPPFLTPSYIQTKLTIGEPGDKYEQEADAMAEKVVQKLDISNSSPDIQNKCDDCEQEENLQKMEAEEMTISKKPIFESDDRINNKLIQGKGIDEVDPSVETQLQNSKGSGQPLDKGTRQNMEQSFGADFTGVKVHTGNNAVQMNQSLGAQAFTNGSNIYFNKGNYNPSSKNGNKLLAHELTHVVQQGAAVQTKRKTEPANYALQTLLENDETTSSNSMLFKKEIASFQQQNPASEILQKQEMIQSQEMVGEVKETTNRSKVQRVCGGCGNGCSPSQAPPTTTTTPATPPSSTAVPTVTGTLTPKDNFTGRSTTQYGVGEEIDLNFTTTATGPLPSGVGLEWTKKSGLGAVVNNSSNNGKGTFTAGDRAGRVELELKVVGGTHAGTVVDTKAFDVVEPSGAYMERTPGTGIWHQQGSASVGFKGDTYYTPKDVSFHYTNMREGSCAGIGTGYFSGDNGQVHPVGTWLSVGTGNASKGSKDNSTDTVSTGPHTRTPYTAGTFLWPIPWQFKVGSGSAKTLTTANHSEVVDSTGKASISKAGAGPFSKELNDSSSGY